MPDNPFSAIPSIERLLQRDDMQSLVSDAGHQVVRDNLRLASDTLRAELRKRGTSALPDNVAQYIADQATSGVASQSRPSLAPVFNLTGTVLHTNLGRATLPDNAIQAICNAARHPVNVEYDLASGSRGDRDVHVESLLCELTGAQAATVVNNNAAAVILCLNSLASGKHVAVSRGELVEIGGSFRMPDIMASAGCQLVEVGTTNRTHLRDYEQAIGPDTAALMTVDPSNYVVSGFTTQLRKADIAQVAHSNNIPLIDDLGSGALVDLQSFGLPHETTVSEAVATGADIITFSGDKLLGGPQAGLIVGRRELIDRIKRNPMKRALRLDKLRLAALESVLRLYQAPEKLASTLPSIALLTRAGQDIRETATRLIAELNSRLAAQATFEMTDCKSQIGSGALPADLLPSTAITINPQNDGASHGDTLHRWSTALRQLPRPVIGRIQDDRLHLDVRTLLPHEEATFISQLDALQAALRPA